MKISGLGDEMVYKIKEFWEFCKNGDIEKVKKCVEEGVNIHSTSERGLGYACVRDDIDIVDYLVNYAQADYNINDGEMLCQCAKSSGVETLCYLLNKHISDKKGQKAIIRAIASGNLKALKVLSKYKKGYLLNGKTLFYEKLCFNACRSGNAEIIKYVNDNIVKLKTFPQKEYSHHSYFEIVCMSGNLEAIELIVGLLENEIPIMCNREIIQTIMWTKSIEMVNWMESRWPNLDKNLVSGYIYTSEINDLYYLFRKGYSLYKAVGDIIVNNIETDKIYELLKLGYDINENNGQVLQYILRVSKDRIQTVLYLQILNSCSYDFKNNFMINGRLLFTDKNFSEDAILFVLNQGVEINLLKNLHDCMLYFAVENNCYIATKFLIEHGADVNRGAGFVDTMRKDGCIEINMPQGQGLCISINKDTIVHKDYIRLYDKESIILLQAISKKNILLVKLLIENGAKYKKIGGYVIPRSKTYGIYDEMKKFL